MCSLNVDLFLSSILLCDSNVVMNIWRQNVLLRFSGSMLFVRCLGIISFIWCINKWIVEKYVLRLKLKDFFFLITKERKRILRSSKSKKITKCYGIKKENYMTSKVDVPRIFIFVKIKDSDIVFDASISIQFIKKIFW